MEPISTSLPHATKHSQMEQTFKNVLKCRVLKVLGRRTTATENRKDVYSRIELSSSYSSFTFANQFPIPSLLEINSPGKCRNRASCCYYHSAEEESEDQMRRREVKGHTAGCDRARNRMENSEFYQAPGINIRGFFFLLDNHKNYSIYCILKDRDNFFTPENPRSNHGNPLKA